MVSDTFSQATGEMYTRNVPLAIITNFENYMVLERQSSGSTSPEVVHCSDLVSVSSVPSRTSLHQSPFGLFLSVTLRACSLRGIWNPSEPIEQDDRSYVEGGLAVSNRSASIDADADRSDDVSFRYAFVLFNDAESNTLCKVRGAASIVYPIRRLPPQSPLHPILCLC